MGRPKNSAINPSTEPRSWRQDDTIRILGQQMRLELKEKNSRCSCQRLTLPESPDPVLSTAQSASMDYSPWKNHKGSGQRRESVKGRQYRGVISGNDGNGD